MRRPRLHPSARTTRAQRRAIQRSRDTDSACAARYGLNVKTVAKWRRRSSVEDAPAGQSRKPALTYAQRALAAAVRQYTWGSLETLLPRLSNVLLYPSRASVYDAWREWAVSRRPRTLKPPDFPFVEQPGLQPAKRERLHICAFSLESGQTILFGLCQRSGWLWARLLTALDPASATAFLDEAADKLREAGGTIGSVLTLNHEAFWSSEIPQSCRIPL